ncbi:MAG: hypothetical protein HRU76_00900 [Phycisphaeraceae bacterium]|nr:MAG: hypothetical protein HRU76_00900 [Phycisphaeraceae bacterium]
MNHTKILNWVKKNLFIVIFAVLIIAAYVALPIFSGGISEDVARAMAARKGKDNDLSRLTTTGIELNDPTPWFTRPSQSTSLINPAARDAFKAYADARMNEVTEVVSTVEAHNRRGRTVFVPDLLPGSVQGGMAEIKWLELSEKLNSAYVALLTDIGAGAPPTAEGLRRELLRLQNQFMTATLARTGRDRLEPEEEAQLRDEMVGRRVALCEEAARQIQVYASLDAINPPSWNYGQPSLTPTIVWYWQWDYWAIEDVLRALKEANRNAASVLDAPVKRIVSIRVEGSEEARKRDTGGGGAAPGGGGGPFISGGGASMGGGGAAPPPGGESAGRPAGVAPADPSQEVKPDFTKSMTGRATNPLYDVRYVNVHLVVETDRVPDVIDAISRQNLMTVVDLEMWPTDPYADLEVGYVYGGVQTSNLTLRIESVWLRSWTAPFMPDEVKRALGVPTQTNQGTSPANP